MKTETMTPEWVVENFLPDYERRKAEVDPINFVHQYFFRTHFPEALSELLKAQRTICAVIYGEMADDYDNILCGRIQDAHIPEPKNRK